jgi:hypothetical protein
MEAAMASGALVMLLRDGYVEERDPADCERRCTREGKIGRQERVCGAAPPRRYRYFSAADFMNSDEEFLSDGGVSGSGSGGRRERVVWA